MAKSKRKTNNGATRPMSKNGGGAQNLAVNYPMARGMAGVTVMSGTDFITTVGVKADISSAQDRILATIPVQPTFLEGTRIGTLGQLWERYRFGKFTVRWVPAVPTALSCQLVAYQDTDPNDDPTIIDNPDFLIRQATAQIGSRQWNFWEKQSIPLAQRKDDQMYYTGEVKENARFSRQGVIYLIQVTAPQNILGQPVAADLTSAGSLFVDWEICLATPQINPTFSGGSGGGELPDAPWINNESGDLLFSYDSSGQFNNLIQVMNMTDSPVNLWAASLNSFDVEPSLNATGQTEINMSFGVQGVPEIDAKIADVIVRYDVGNPAGFTLAPGPLEVGLDNTRPFLTVGPGQNFIGTVSGPIIQDEQQVADVVYRINLLADGELTISDF